MNIRGKSIVVGGGSGGIGSAVVEALHKKGAVVYAIDLQPPETPIRGVRYILADLTHGAEVANAITHISGHVDAVFLNAGIMRRGTLLESSEEEYDLLFGANVKSAWLLLKHLQPRLAKDATILQMSSSHALHPEPDPGLYTLTKKTTAALAELLALTYPHYDVKLIYPGPVLTNLLLTGRSDSDKTRISKIAHQPAAIADKIIDLLESPHKTLKFDPKNWDYSIE